MNVASLRYFQYIAKYKNITQAAKHLYISQSTLSRHIMALEDELGVRLFERNNKMVSLTEAGKTLYQDCDSFINHMDSLMKNVASAGKGHIGTLRVTSPKSLSNYLQHAVKATQETYPMFRFLVEAYEFGEIPLAIKHNLYHVGITYDFALYEHEDLEILPFGTDEFVFVYSADYRKEDDISTLANLIKSIPFIYPAYVNPPFLREALSVAQDVTGCHLVPTYNVNTTESLLISAALGLGFGLLPLSWWEQLNPNQQLAVLRPPKVTTTTDVVAICKKNRESELTDTFFRALIAKRSAGSVA
ncbi:MAG: LysR family transcriptional regulator [Lachnospiraceae bacterium]|jgi:DNA-binding transcriptional LysR family regulator|nr:LysR family transcriptional regulator [Lachnospiraceae bacterium]